MQRKARPGLAGKWWGFSVVQMFPCENLSLSEDLGRDYCPFYLQGLHESHTHQMKLWMCAKSLQLCPTLCDPMGYSLPGPSVHGILQAKILEQVAISFSRGPSQPRDRTCVSYVSCTGRQVLYHLSHLGSPGPGLVHPKEFLTRCHLAHSLVPWENKQRETFIHSLTHSLTHPYNSYYLLLLLHARHCLCIYEAYFLVEDRQESHINVELK